MKVKEMRLERSRAIAKLLLIPFTLCFALVPAKAQIMMRADPSTYTCADYIGAGAPPAGEQAERMLYWLAGHVGGKLTATAPVVAQAWPFPLLSAHIHSYLLMSCSSHPGMTISAFVEGIATAILKMHDTVSHPYIR